MYLVSGILAIIKRPKGEQSKSALELRKDSKRQGEFDRERSTGGELGDIYMFSESHLDLVGCDAGRS